jgi:hypothetical protein
VQYYDWRVRSSFTSENDVALACLREVALLLEDELVVLKQQPPTGRR